MHTVLSTVMLAIEETGLSFLVFGTVAFSLVLSLLFLVTRGSDSMYDHIGQGGLSRDSDHGAGAPAADRLQPATALGTGSAEREQEIRQMLGARSERLVRRGEPALDIDAEVARLLAPAQQQPTTSDAGLSEEVRQLVHARNERRVRQGLEPLEVEAEVARTLAELEA